MKRRLFLFIIFMTGGLPGFSHAQHFTSETIEKMASILTDDDYLVVEVALSPQASRIFIEEKFKGEVDRLTRDLDAAASIAAVSPVNSPAQLEYLEYAKIIRGELDHLLNQPVTLTLKISVEKAGKQGVRDHLQNHLKLGSTIRSVRNYSKTSEVPVPKIYSPALDGWVPYELDPYIWCKDAMA